jgi:hypothetical protein
MDAFNIFDIGSVVVYQVFIFWHLFPLYTVVYAVSLSLRFAAVSWIFYSRIFLDCSVIRSVLTCSVFSVQYGLEWFHRNTHIRISVSSTALVIYCAENAFRTVHAGLARDSRYSHSHQYTRKTFATLNTRTFPMTLYSDLSYELFSATWAYEKYTHYAAQTKKVPTQN